MSSRGIVLHGLRGVGKTVLLNQFRAQADRAEWFTVELEGRTTETGHAAVRQKLGRALLLAGRKLQRSKHYGERMKTALGTVRSFSLSLGVASLDLGIEPSQGRADSGQIEVDFEEVIEDLAPALQENSSAFGIFIDEMQDLDNDLLVALLAAQHRAGQMNWPFYIIGAGLPALPSTLSEARSYAERLFNYREVGALGRESAAAALTIPMSRNGADFESDALELLLTASGGYPYFLQSYGQAVWGIAPNQHITKADAVEAVLEGNAALDMGFFPARWDRATSSERRYLAAMAESGEMACRTADVANRLRQSLGNLSQVRQSLIAKGVIYVPERGQVAFTVPGMAAFIDRQFQD
jgi:hypothetical protein